VFYAIDIDGRFLAVGIGGSIGGSMAKDVPQDFGKAKLGPKVIKTLNFIRETL